MNDKPILDVSVDDGKYRVLWLHGGRIHALRWDEPWRDDLVGDKLVLALAQELQDARGQIERLQVDLSREQDKNAELKGLRRL